MARSLASALNAPLLASTISRLLIDLNRPAGHPHVYSMVTRNARAELRAEIARRHHEPYLTEVERLVEQFVALGRRVIHVASHTFTPVLNGRVRRADVGLLYDPARQGEVELCAHWKAGLNGRAPKLRVRRNYPYRGTAPGVTVHLRRLFSAEAYLGIELEVNQSLVFAGRRCWTALRRVLTQSLLAACATLGRPLQK